MREKSSACTKKRMLIYHLAVSVITLAVVGVAAGGMFALWLCLEQVA